MPTVFLNAEEKLKGQLSMRKAEFFNGFASNLLGETIIILLATHFAASNVVLGYLSSALFVSGIILPWIPRFLNNKNFERAHFTVWLLRGVFSLAYIGLFWLSGNLAVVLIVATYSMFCLFRVIGITLNDFSMKSISSLKNRGKVFAEVSLIYQGSSLLAKIISIIITSISALSGLLGLMILPQFGILANFFSSYWYLKIPCRRNFKYNPKRSLWVIMGEMFKQKNTRRKVILKWITQSIYVVMAMSVPFLKNVVGMSSSMVLFFTVIASCAMILASFVCGRIADRMGSKPLIIIFSIMLLIVIGAWIAVPHTAEIEIFFFLGFAYNFLLTLIILLVQRLVASIIPDDEAIPFNSMVNFGIGISAFISGILAGVLVSPGTLIFENFVWGNEYSLTFLLALAYGIFALILAIGLKETKSYTTQQAFHAIFTMRGLKAFTMIGKIDKTKDPLKRKILLFNLGTNFTGIATEELRARLASPYSVEKQEIIRALADKPRKALVKELSKIALDDDSYVQMDAIVALGSYKGNQIAIDTLQKLLDCRWSQVRSQASRSLSQITDARVFDRKIEDLSKISRHIDEEIDYIIAKNNIDDEGLFLRDFWVAVKNQRSSGYRQTRYSVLAGCLHFGTEKLSRFYEILNSGSKEDFLEDFLSDARDVEEIDSNYDSLFQYFIDENWVKVFEFCISLIKKAQIDYNQRFYNLRIGLLEAENIPIESFDIQDMVAFLYFSYALKKNSK